jgi:hypothetical protein
LAVGVRDVAIPELLVDVVKLAKLLALANVPPVPLDGAVNVTDAFGTGLPPPSLTEACNSAANEVPIVALCAEPLDTEITTAVPGNTVNWKLFDVMTLCDAVMFGLSDRPSVYE